MSEIKVTTANYNETVVNSPLPVVVDFWATWCGPCSMIAPVLAEIAEEMEGTITVGKVNVDEEMALAQQFGIVSIPSLLLMKGGKAVSMVVGYHTKEELLSWIKEKL